MKKILILIALISTLITLQACDEQTSQTNQATQLIELIRIGYEPGDSENSITKDITLPKSLSGFDQVELTWLSLDQTVLSQNGVVTRKSDDVQVNLILRLKIGELVAQKTFQLTILGTQIDITLTLIVFDEEDIVSLSMPLELSLIDIPFVSGYRFLNWELLDGTDLLSSYVIQESMTIRAVFETAITYTYTINIYRENSFYNGYELLNSISSEGVKDDIVLETFNQEGFILNQELSDLNLILSNNQQVFNRYYDYKEFSVIYYVNGVIYDQKVFKYNQTLTYPTLNEVFLGWSLSPQGSLIPESYNITESITIYAVFETEEVTYSGYYASIDDVNDIQLLSALRTIISSYTFQTYDKARDILQDSDEDPNNSNNILLVYNRESVRSTWDSGNTWNREHVWPQSLLNNSDQKADTHNLKPANPSINSSRGNDQYAQGSGTYGKVNGGFFPGDQDKGDIARIVMYMHVRWGLNINLVGKIQILLQWHQQDAVDDFELNRNEVIASYSKNRNPFIDHPELAYRLFGQPSFYTAYDQDIYDAFIHIQSDIYIEKNKTL
jgi:endonuclease I